MSTTPIELAKHYHRAGRLQEAEALYRQVLLAQPANVEALHYLGMLSLNAGRGDAGLALMLQASKLGPDDPLLFNNIGTALTMLKRFEEAISAFERSVALNPGFVEAQFNLGRLLVEVGRPDPAIASLKAALDLRPGFAHAHFELGKIYSSRHDYPAALEHLQRAIAAMPQMPEAHYQMGMLLLRMGKASSALASLQQALALRPQFAEARFALGEAQFTLGDHDAAKAAYQLSTGRRADEGTFVCTLVPMSQLAAEHGRVFRLAEPAEWQIPDPAFIGGKFGAQGGAARTNELFVGELQDAQVFSRSDLVFRKPGQAALDLMLPPQGEIANMWLELQIRYHSGHKLFIDIAPYQQISAKSGFTLLGASAPIYGHWLIDYLPKIKLLDAIPEYDGLPIYIDQGLFPTQIEALELLTGGRHEIVQVPAGASVHFERLVTASHFTFFPTHCRPGIPLTSMVSPVSIDACKYLRDTMLAACGLDASPRPAGQRGRRIFVGRSEKLRSMVNQEELHALFAKHGFELVHPEKLSFREQVRLFNEAECVAGAHGSVFINVLFCKPGAKVINLVQSHGANFASWAYAVETLGHRHLYVAGEAIHLAGMDEHHLDYRMPLELAEQALRTMGLD